MKTYLMKQTVIVSLMVLGAVLAAHAGEIKVIANASVNANAISQEELRNVFLENTTSLSDGSPVQPVLMKGGSAHEAFLKTYVGKSDSVLQTYYRSLIFTGKGSMPKVLNSDAEVVSYVAKTKGAIGYVGAATDTGGTKVLQLK